MQPGVTTALVLGGTGTVGSAVLAELARRGVRAAFSFRTQADKAKALAAEHGHVGFAVDLVDPAATRAALDAAFPVGDPAAAGPSVLIHCAGVSASQPLIELEIESWQRAAAINVGSALVAVKWLAERHRSAAASKRHVVLVGGLDRAQSLPLPASFAATQGALSALAMALGHELGPAGIHVNLVALGVLEGGISRDLMNRRRKDYETFSALRRVGKPDEAAKVIAWLALENTYIQGKVLAVNGGI